MKSDGESDEEERRVSVSQKILYNKGEERWDGLTEAAAARVGADLKTSDKCVYANGIGPVVVNSGQGFVAIVADRHRGATVVGDWLWKIIERESQLLIRLNS